LDDVSTSAPSRASFLSRTRTRASVAGQRRAHTQLQQAYSRAHARVRSAAMSDDDDDWTPLSERLEWADVTPLPLVRARVCALLRLLWLLSWAFWTYKCR
jgi:hypothetical protein